MTIHLSVECGYEVTAQFVENARNWRPKTVNKSVRVVVRN